MLTAAGLNRGTLTVRRVHNIIITLNAAVPLVLWLPVGAAGQRGLEGTVGPRVRLVGLVAGGALQIVEVTAVVGKGNCGKESCKDSGLCSLH